jgi:hypothetical protein
MTLGLNSFLSSGFVAEWNLMAADLGVGVTLDSTGDDNPCLRGEISDATRLHVPRERRAHYGLSGPGDIYYTASAPGLIHDIVRVNVALAISGQRWRCTP